MRKIGLLAVLTLGCMVAFSSVVMAATTAVGPAGTPGIPNATGTNGTAYTAPTSADIQSVDPAGIKFDSPTNSKIHSSYSKTTDACASCHAVHTAISNDGTLLQFADAQTACWACHDGTVAATYDVQNGTHNGGVVSSAGQFGLAGDTNVTNRGLSTHGMAPGQTALVSLSAAPGGSEASVADKNGVWDEEFSCVACHDPHGTFANARILNPDVNGAAAAAKANMVLAGGELLTTSDNLTFTTAAPFLTAHGYDSVVTVDAVPVTTGFTLDGPNAKIVFAAAQTGVVKASTNAGLIVKMDIADKLTATETVKYQSGMNQFCGACHTDYNNVGKTLGTRGTGGAYKEALGEYRVAYRHSVGFTRTADAADPTFLDVNSLDASYPGLVFEKSNYKTVGTLLPTVNCVTCHYAHGTSDAFIAANLTKQMGPVAEAATFGGNNATGSTILQTYDLTRSSALKRLPNMGVCQGCHNKQ